ATGAQLLRPQPRAGEESARFPTTFRARDLQSDHVMHTVSELMTPSPIVIDVHQPLAEASERMEQFRLRHLPVIDARGRLVGILSELDLYRFKDKRPRADLENMAVGPAMDPNPSTPAPDAPLPPAP